MRNNKDQLTNSKHKSQKRRKKSNFHLSQSPIDFDEVFDRSAVIDRINQILTNCLWS